MIRTEALVFRHAGGLELNFPDVHVPQGGMLLLRGPSGSGKSTWLALAAGLVNAAAGFIEVAGYRLSAGNQPLAPAAQDAWRAQTVGLLPQKLHLSPALTVYENLALAQWAAGRASDAARISETLAALNVQDLQKRKPAQISGGQAQRVALARAVLLRPLVILADEPTASLDDEAASAAIGLLCTTARREGATLVIATHDARARHELAKKAGDACLFSLNLTP